MNIHANNQTLWPQWHLHFHDFHILTDSLDQAKLDIIYCYSEKTTLCYDFINILLIESGWGITKVFCLNRPNDCFGSEITALAHLPYGDLASRHSHFSFCCPTARCQQCVAEMSVSSNTPLHHAAMHSTILHCTE